MRFDNSQVRRQDRLLGEAEALELLRLGEYGVLSMHSPEGAYGVPVNYVLDGDVIYVHCAPEGRKLRSVEHDSKVSFCVVGNVSLKPEEFTTHYSSVIVEGRASVVEGEQEKRCALRRLIEKYSPQYVESGNAAIQRSEHRTAIIAIKVESISAKCKD